MNYAETLGPQFEMLGIYSSRSRDRHGPFNPAALLEMPLVVVLDMDSAPSNDHPVRRAVEALATSELFEVWRYSDLGAPDDIARVAVRGRHSQRLLPKGWLQIAQQPESGDISPRSRVTHVVEGSRRRDQHQAHLVWDHPDTWRPGVVYASAREAHEALLSRALTQASELFISSRQGIAGTKRCGARHVHEGILAQWEAGAAILGRLARQSGKNISVGPYELSGEGLYYSMAVEDLLPHLRTATDTLLECGINPDHLLALRGRVTQVLLARDDLAMALGTESSSIRETDAIDRVLVFTLAAFDELAHLAGATFRLNLSAPSTKWDRPNFLAALRYIPEARGLADLYEPSHRPAAVLRVLRYVRNLVHGTGLNELTVLTDPVSGTIASLSAPAPDAHDIGSALEATAYRGWGLHFVGDRLFVDTETLAEKVAFEAFRLMDRTLEKFCAADVARLGRSSRLLPIEEETTSDARVLRLAAAQFGNVGNGGLCAQLGLMHARRRVN